MKALIIQMEQLRAGINFFLPILGLESIGFQNIHDSHYNCVEFSYEDTDNEEEMESDTDNEIDDDNYSIFSDNCSILSDYEFHK